jgi:RimJ/RimL family protein N-acetyltransferase
MSEIIAETPRLLLRRMTDADAEGLLALCRNPNVMRFIPGEPPTETLEDALRVLHERVYPQYALGPWLGRWAVELKATGEFLGWCGLKRLDDGEIDLGYRFFEERWGNGYATEAASATRDIALAHHRGERVVGRAMPENAASRRVLEKLGLALEGEAEEEGILLISYVLRT